MVCLCALVKAIQYFNQKRNIQISKGLLPMARDLSYITALSAGNFLELDSRWDAMGNYLPYFSCFLLLLDLHVICVSCRPWQYINHE